MEENTFLANLQQEGQLLDQPVELEREEKETPPESPAETKPEDKTASPAEEKEKGEPEPEKGDEPKVFASFDTNPRWIARQRELEELQKKSEEYDAFRARVEPLLERFEKEPQQVNKEVPGWFSTLFGNNEEAWGQYQSHSQEEQKRVIEAVKNELKPVIEVAEKTKEQSDLDSWADKEWKALEGDENVQKELKQRNLSLDRKVQEEIGEILAKYSPTDEKGNLSLRKGFELWKDLKVPKTSQPNPAVEEKKRVADKTITKTVAEGEKRDFRTSADFKGKSFIDLIAR